MAKTASKKTMEDVAKPGKTAPSSTSKPVIVGHGPMLKDPVLTSKETSKPKDDIPLPATAKVIKPPEPSEPEEKKEETPPEAEVVTKDDSASEENVGQADDPTLPEEEKPDQKQTAALEAEQAKRDALTKLIAEKKYFVKTSAAQTIRRTSHIFSITLLVIILAAVGLNFAVDAGLIKTNISPLTDLIDPKK